LDQGTGALRPVEFQRIHPLPLFSDQHHADILGPIAPAKECIGEAAF